MVGSCSGIRSEVTAATARMATADLPATASPAQLTSAAAMKGSVLDVFHQLWQIAVEVEMIPGEHSVRELACRAVAPRCHVFRGDNPILVPDERVNRTRHRRPWRAGIPGNGTGGAQCGQHSHDEFFVGKHIRIHAGNPGDQVQYVMIGKTLELLVFDMAWSCTGRQKEGDDRVSCRLESQRYFERQHPAHTVTKEGDRFVGPSRGLHHRKDIVGQGGNARAGQAAPIALSGILDSDSFYVGGILSRSA